MRNFKFILFIIGISIINTISSQNLNTKSLSIQDIFDLADNYSRRIRIDNISVLESNENIRIAKNSLLPSIETGISISYLGDAWLSKRNFSDGINAPMPHFGNNFAIEAVQILYSGGAISSNIALAKLNQQITMLDLEKNRQEIRFLLLGNYLEIFKLKNQEQVFINNIIQTQKLLSDIQNRQEEGVALRNDITRYELQLKSLELQLEQIQNRIKIINYDLVITLGLPDETIIDIDKQILHNIPVITQEIIWQQQAATSSINLKQSLLNIEQTKQTEKLVNSERLPSFALFAGDNLDGPIIIEVPPINKNLNYWYVGVGMTYNISSLYTSQKKYKQAKLATRKAIEANEYLKDNLRSAIKTAYIKFLESFSIYDTGIKSLELANQNYEVINNRYLNDLALITDMLDASNSKLNAELQLVNSQINILFNYYNLKKTVDSL